MFFLNTCKVHGNALLCKTSSPCQMLVKLCLLMSGFTARHVQLTHCRWFCLNYAFLNIFCFLRKCLDFSPLPLLHRRLKTPSACKSLSYSSWCNPSWLLHRCIAAAKSLYPIHCYAFIDCAVLHCQKVISVVNCRLF